MKCRPFLVWALVAVGCSPRTKAVVSTTTAAPPPPVNRFQAMKLAVENRSPWEISLEPMVGIRVGSSNVFGPPEEMQRGPSKTLSKVTIGGFFGSIKGVTTKAEDGQAVMIHVVARPPKDGPNVCEAYLAFPSEIFNARPDQITFHADEKEIRTGGAYVSNVAWIKL